MVIDFVSDIACPWCAVGLNALERALQALQASQPDFAVQIRFQPYELNPDMAAEGADTLSYLRDKYGMTAQQLAQNQETLRQRGAEVGFVFGARERVWNTFEGHRMLYWAGVEGPPDAQRALKHALLRAYHAQGLNPSDPQLLERLAVEAGLDGARAREVIAQDLFRDEVRQAQGFWQQAGIRSVPSVVVNRKHLIQGGQPPQVFETALRQIAAEGEGAAQH